MPLYEYQCLACGRRHEQIQRMADPPLTVCPDCGGALKKLVSSPAFQFKGTGWYVTDYAAKKGAGTDGAKSAGKGEGAEASAGQRSEKGSAQSPEKSSEKSSEKSLEKSSEAKASSDSKSTPAANTSAKKDSAKSADS